MIREYTVQELSVYDDKTGECQVQMVSDPITPEQPLALRAFAPGHKFAFLDTWLSRNECRELRDFFNSLDLD